MAKFTPISEVDPTYSPTAVKGLYNPYDEPYEFKFAGKVLVAEPLIVTPFPEAVAAHGAKHLAWRIMHNTVLNFALEKFPDLDERGREKWRTQTTHYVAKRDVKALQAQLLVDVQYMGQDLGGVNIPEVKEQKEEQTFKVPSGQKPTADNVSEELDLKKKASAAKATTKRATKEPANPSMKGADLKTKSKADAAKE